MDGNMISMAHAACNYHEMIQLSLESCLALPLDYGSCHFSGESASSSLQCVRPNSDWNVQACSVALWVRPAKIRTIFKP